MRYCWLEEEGDKEMGTTILSPQGSEFCLKPVNLQEEPQLQRRTIALANTLILAQ